MIQSAMIFLLGFLCAAFLILLAAPLFWRRAHYLWQKQMAAQLPLSLTAIEADRDLLRATHAAELRKAQMQAAELREKHTQALLKISTDRTELEKIPALIQELDVSKIRQSADHQQLTAMQEEWKTLQKRLQTVIEEHDRLTRQNEALNQLCGNLRDDVSTRDKEADRLRRDTTELRLSKKQLNKTKSELASQVAALNTALESEKQRNQALEEKLHRLITEFSDAQEKLERQDKNLREKHSIPHNDSRTLNDQDHSLREKISDLAAEVVAATAAQEGENSPILTILNNNKQASPSARKRKKNKTKSLADRIDKYSE